MVVGQRHVGLEPGVRLNDGPEAVQLVRPRSREDRLAFVPRDGRWQVMVVGGVVDPLEADPLGHKLVPTIEHLGLKEARYIVGRIVVLGLKLDNPLRNWACRDLCQQ